MTKRFSGTEFDMAADHGSDSPSLAFQIGVALQDAGWKWDARPEILGLTFGKLPMIGSAFVTGLRIRLCQSDFSAFKPAMDAVYFAPKVAQLNITADVYPPADSVVQKEKCGMLHIVVGSRT